MFPKKHGLLCWRTPIFPGRHQPSIFGTNELNFRVRDGNGWTLVVINTNYSLATGSHRTASLLYHTCLRNASLFSKFFKKFLPRPAGPNGTARTRYGQRPLPRTANTGCLSFSRRKFRAVRPGPEPGMGSALFPALQTRAAHLPLAASPAPPRRVARAACAAGAKIKQPPDWATASCVGEHLSSRAVTSQVFSARTSLTSVFGMGTGGPSS